METALPMIEKAEPTIEDPLSTTEEAEPAVEAPLPAKAEAVAPTEGGGLVEGLTEVPSPSWALEPIDDVVEINVTRVVFESGP